MVIKITVESYWGKNIRKGVSCITMEIEHLPFYIKDIVWLCYFFRSLLCKHIPAPVSQRADGGGPDCLLYMHVSLCWLRIKLDFHLSMWFWKAHLTLCEERSVPFFLFLYVSLPPGCDGGTLQPLYWPVGATWQWSDKVQVTESLLCDITKPHGWLTLLVLRVLNRHESLI